MDAKIRCLFSLKLERVKAERQERQNAAWHFLLERGGLVGNVFFFFLRERWGKGWGDVLVGSVRGFVGGLLGWTYS